MEEIMKENVVEENEARNNYETYSGEVCDPDDEGTSSMSGLVIAGLAVAGVVAGGLLLKKKIGGVVEKAAVKSLQKKGYSVYEPEKLEEDISKEDDETE